METYSADKNTVDSILGLTRSLLDKFSLRAPGSNNSIDTAESLRKFMSGFCDETYSEDFTMHPGALFSVCKIIGTVYILSVLFLLLGGYFLYISSVLCIVAFIYSFIHFFLYGKTFDRLFKKQTGCNAIGVLEPSCEVKQQVIISGHHDSAFIFSFFSRFEGLAGIRFLLAMIFYIYICVYNLTSAFNFALYRVSPLPVSPAFILAVIGLLFTIPLIFFISKKVSPGAGDNLNGSSLSVHIGRLFADMKKNGDGLKNTKLILLSTDGEEAGQRGAIAYAERHRNELLSVPSFVINTDSVYKKKDLAVMLRDRHGFVPLSTELSQKCLDIAFELGYTMKKISFPFGSGTDAAAFARTGVEAVSIIGMPTSLFEKGHTYHSSNDTLESIEPEAVEALFNIVTNMILRIDEK